MNSTRIMQRLLCTAAFFAAPAPLSAQLLVTPQWLNARLKAPDVVTLEVDMRPIPGRAVIPGAQNASVGALTRTRDAISYELQTVDSIKSVLEPLGISTLTHVVLYGDVQEVARLVFTLDQLGLKNVHVMPGGLLAWKLAGFPTEKSSANSRPRGKIDVPANVMPTVVTADWVQKHIGAPGVRMIDTRTPTEYDGTGDRRGMRSDGHIQGARRIDWESLLDADNPQSLKDIKQLTEIYRGLGVAPTDTIVTYCAVGARASVTYFVGRILGQPTRLFDGSYDEWSKKGLPLVKSEQR